MTHDVSSFDGKPAAITKIWRTCGRHLESRNLPPSHVGTARGVSSTYVMKGHVLARARNQWSKGMLMAVVLLVADSKGPPLSTSCHSPAEGTSQMTPQTFHPHLRRLLCAGMTLMSCQSSPAIEQRRKKGDHPADGNTFESREGLSGPCQLCDRCPCVGSRCRVQYFRPPIHHRHSRSPSPAYLLRTRSSRALLFPQQAAGRGDSPLERCACLITLRRATSAPEGQYRQLAP